MPASGRPDPPRHHRRPRLLARTLRQPPLRPAIDAGDRRRRQPRRPGRLLLALLTPATPLSPSSATSAGRTRKKIAESLVSGLPAGQPASLPAAPALPKESRQVIVHPAAQAHIYLGLPAVERGQPGFLPAAGGQLHPGGGGFVSPPDEGSPRQARLRLQRLTATLPLRQAGPFQIGLQTKRSQARDALAVSRSVLETFLKEGPTADELTAAKANLTAASLRLDSNKKILDNVANIGFNGLPLDYLDRYQANIQAVTAEDVKRVFAKYVQPAHLVTVLVAAD